jgi:chemotaxis protein MotB
MMRWLLTYADMITLLLAFFIVLYASSTVNAKKIAEVAAGLRGAFGVASPQSKVADTGVGGERLLTAPDMLARLLEEIGTVLRGELQDGKVEVLRTSRGLILRFRDSTFFDLGQATLTAEARQILDRMAPLLKGIPNAIEAEGHTDDLPIRSAQFPSNWELSTARATAVLRHLIEAHGFTPERLSARGLAEYRPLVPNEPGRGESRNRRVEVNILR